jgi:hypothetical protein
MWQPSTRQWTIISVLAVLLVLAWPPDEGRSLGVKLVNWAADPMNRLPTLPPTLPFGMDDNGDAVAEHDMIENAYYQARQRSPLTRWRMDLKEAADPLERSTERQILIGLAVAGALLVWRLEAVR